MHSALRYIVLCAALAAALLFASSLHSVYARINTALIQVSR
jgi:hypothetical protein